MLEDHNLSMEVIAERAEIQHLNQTITYQGINSNPNQRGQFGLRNHDKRIQNYKMGRSSEKIEKNEGDILDRGRESKLYEKESEIIEWRSSEEAERRNINEISIQKLGSAKRLDNTQMPIVYSPPKPKMAPSRSMVSIRCKGDSEPPQDKYDLSAQGLKRSIGMRGQGEREEEERKGSRKIPFEGGAMNTGGMGEGGNISQVTQVSEHSLIEQSPIHTLNPRPKLTNKVLILDLDETLIHSIINMEKQYFTEWDSEKGTIYSTKDKQQLFYARPGLTNFLRFANERFEVVLYTAGGETYVYKILDEIDPRRRYFDHILTREHCRIVYTGLGDDIGFTKGLERLNRNPANIIIVDDRISNWVGNYKNLIPIKPYVGEKNDEELWKLMELLKKLGEVSDVRADLSQRIMNQEEM